LQSGITVRGRRFYEERRDGVRWAFSEEKELRPDLQTMAERRTMIIARTRWGEIAELSCSHERSGGGKGGSVNVLIFSHNPWT